MQKIYLFAIICFLLAGTTVNAQVGIGTTTPDISAMLDITSSSTGLLIPRMDSVTRTSIKSPADGLMVYDTDYQSFYYYKGGYDWIPMGFIPQIALPKVGFYATLSSARSLPNITYASLAPYSKSYDYSNNFNASTGIFTAPDTAVYHFTISVELTVTSTSTSVFTILCQKNGSTAPAGTKTTIIPAVTGTFESVSASIDILLNKDDTFSYKFQQKSGASQTVNGGTVSTPSTIFSGFKVF